MMPTLVRDVLLPRGCAGCDAPDHVLCPDCLGGFQRRMSRPMPGTAMGRGFSLAAYRGAARRAILSWKDHGDEECDIPFARLMSDLCVDCGAVVKERPSVLVPAPSSPASMRARGRWHMASLTGRMARLLRLRGYAVTSRPLLRATNVSGKSVQVSSAMQRAARVRGNIRVSGTPQAGLDVIVVDDIVTTGATVRQCVAALNEAGERVVTVLSLACVER